MVDTIEWLLLVAGCEELMVMMESASVQNPVDEDMAACVIDVVTIRVNILTVIRIMLASYQGHHSTLFDAVMSESVDPFPSIDGFCGKILVLEGQMTTSAMSPFQIDVMNARAHRKRCIFE
jgi:hypothetical protein